MKATPEFADPAFHVRVAPVRLEGVWAASVLMPGAPSSPGRGKSPSRKAKEGPRGGHPAANQTGDGANSDATPAPETKGGHSPARAPFPGFPET